MAIHAVLVMPIGAKLEHNRFLYRQLVSTKQFPAIGINAFAIHAVAPAELFTPIHLPAPAVFVQVPRSHIKYPSLLTVEAPFIKKRDPVLQGYICKAVPVVVHGVLVVKIIYPKQRSCFFTRIKFHPDIGVHIHPVRAEYIHCKNRGA